MVQAYGMALRKRVIAASEKGHGTREVALRFDVSESWVRRLKQRLRERGSLEPLPHHPGPKRKLTTEHEALLLKLIEQKPGLTLAQMQSRLPVRVCLQTINSALHRLNISVKKRRYGPANKTDQMS